MATCCVLCLVITPDLWHTRYSLSVRAGVSATCSTSGIFTSRSDERIATCDKQTIRPRAEGSACLLLGGFLFSYERACEKKISPSKIQDRGCFSVGRGWGGKNEARMKELGTKVGADSRSYPNKTEKLDAGCTSYLNKTRKNDAAGRSYTEEAAKFRKGEGSYPDKTGKLDTADRPYPNRTGKLDAAGGSSADGGGKRGAGGGSI